MKIPAFILILVFMIPISYSHTAKRNSFSIFKSQFQQVPPKRKTWLPFSRKFLDSLFLSGQFRNIFRDNTYQKIDKQISISENLAEREFFEAALEELKKGDKSLILLYKTLRSKFLWPKTIPSLQYIPTKNVEKFFTYRLQEIRILLLKEYIAFRAGINKKSRLRSIKKAQTIAETIYSNFEDKKELKTMMRYLKHLISELQDNRLNSLIWLNDVSFPAGIENNWWGSLWLRRAVVNFRNDGFFYEAVDFQNYLYKKHNSLQSNLGRAKTLILAGDYKKAENLLIQKLLQKDPQNISLWWEMYSSQKLYLHLLLFSNQFENASIQYKLALKEIFNQLKRNNLQLYEKQKLKEAYTEIGYEYIVARLASDEERAKIIENVNQFPNLTEIQKQKFRFGLKKYQGGKKSKLEYIKKMNGKLFSSITRNRFESVFAQDEIKSQGSDVSLEKITASFILNPFWTKLRYGINIDESFDSIYFNTVRNIFKNTHDRSLFVKKIELLKTMDRVRKLSPENSIHWSHLARQMHSVFIRNNLFHEECALNIDPVPPSSFPDVTMHYHNGHLLFHKQINREVEYHEVKVNEKEFMETLNLLYLKNLKSTKEYRLAVAKLTAMLKKKNPLTNSQGRILLWTNYSINHFPFQDAFSSLSGNALKIVHYIPKSISSQPEIDPLNKKLLALGSSESSFLFGLGKYSDEIDDIVDLFDTNETERSISNMPSILANSKNFHLHIAASFNSSPWRFQFRESSSLDFDFKNFTKSLQTVSISDQKKEEMSTPEWEEFLAALSNKQIRYLFVASAGIPLDYRSSFFYDFYSRTKNEKISNAWFSAISRSEKSFSGDLWPGYVQMYATEK